MAFGMWEYTKRLIMLLELELKAKMDFYIVFPALLYILIVIALVKYIRSH
jgi:hypothetical protein